MNDNGYVETKIAAGIGEVIFSHPKSNSLPATLLQNITQAVANLAKDEHVKVIVLSSEGHKAYCSGASFEELASIKSTQQGQEFFSGFAKLMLAIKNAPKFVIARVHGKVVGGGVGLVATCDYALATSDASIKLSELAIGIGPFVIGPSIIRKIGIAAYSTMSIDTAWRDASWAREKGLYMDVLGSVEELDLAVQDLAKRLAVSSPLAMQRIKEVLWDGTGDWEQLLASRAAISAELMQTDFVKRTISSIKAKDDKKQ